MNIARIYSLVFVIAISLMFGSCSKYFSQTHRTILETNNQDLAKVQYYNDIPIVLRRELTSSDAKTKGGKVKIEAGKQIEYITIKKKTPGLLVETAGEMGVKVSFDEEDSQNLSFFSDTKNSFYQLGKNNNFIQPNGEVVYDGDTYTVTKGFNAKLLFKNKFKYKESTDGRKAKGRKL